MLSLTAAAAFAVVSARSLSFAPPTAPPILDPTPLAPPAPFNDPKKPPANSVRALAPLNAASIPNNGRIGLKAFASVNNPLDNPITNVNNV